MDGRKIFLKENSRSHGSESRGRGRPGRRGGRGTCQLVVNNLSFETTWRDLKDMLRQCGSVERAEIMLNAAGRSKGYGTVRFFDEKDAKAAIERLNDQELRGRILDVRFDTRKH